MSLGRIGANTVKGVLSRLRSTSTSRVVAAQAAQPGRIRNLDDEAEMLARQLRGQVGREVSVADELSQLREALRIERSGARNVNRDRLLTQAARLEARSGKLQAVAGRAGAQRRVLSSGGLDTLNKQWDRADELKRRWSKAASSASDRRKVVDFQGDVELGIPPMRGTPKQIADRMQKVKDDLERRGAKTKRSLANREYTEQRALQKSFEAEEARERLLGRLSDAGPERVVDTSAVQKLERQISEREALLESLKAPTQQAAAQAVNAAPVAGVAADAAEAAAGTAGKRSLKPWAKGNRLLSAGAGFGAYMGLEVGRGFAEDQANSAMAGDRLSSMIRGAADQRLEMLRAMAALQRIQTGARQNLANLAMQQPHVFNEIMAGRQLAPGVVSIGGNRQEQMMRMAEVGSAMATGQFNGMGSPDALGLLNQYMQQG